MAALPRTILLPVAMFFLSFLAAMLVVKPLMSGLPTNGQTSAIARIGYSATASAVALFVTSLWLPTP